MKNLFSASLILVVGSLVHTSASATTKSSSSGIDPKTLCSTESEKHLVKLTQKGETRFSAFQFNPDSTKVSDVEFTDLGATGKRHRKTPQVPAKLEYGQMLVMQAMGKEKTGWRNLVVRCGVHKGKVATFTYEILSMADASAATAATATTTLESGKSATVTPVSAPVATQAAPGPASVQNP